MVSGQHHRRILHRCPGPPQATRVIARATVIDLEYRALDVYVAPLIGGDSPGASAVAPGPAGPQVSEVLDGRVYAAVLGGEGLLVRCECSPRVWLLSPTVLAELEGRGLDGYVIGDRPGDEHPPTWATGQEFLEWKASTTRP